MVVLKLLAATAVAYVATRAAWIFGGSLGVVALALLLAVSAYAVRRRAELFATLGLASGVGGSVGALTADDDGVGFEVVFRAVNGAVGTALLALAGAFAYLAMRRGTAARVSRGPVLIVAVGNALLGAGTLAAMFGYRKEALVAFVMCILAFYVGGRLVTGAPD